MLYNDLRQNRACKQAELGTKKNKKLFVHKYLFCIKLFGVAGNNSALMPSLSDNSCFHLINIDSFADLSILDSDWLTQTKDYHRHRRRLQGK